jgi:hypothetical protein
MHAGPFSGNVLGFGIQGSAINGAGAAQASDDDGTIEAAPAGVGDVAEPKGFALGLRETTELQAHQGHQFGVLVDRFVNYMQQSPATKNFHVLTQITIRHSLVPFLGIQVGELKKSKTRETLGAPPLPLSADVGILIFPFPHLLVPQVRAAMFGANLGLKKIPP